MKKYYLSFLLSVGLLSAFAQTPYEQKMNFQLRAYLDKPVTGLEMVDLFIHGEKDAVSAAVQAVGGQVKLTLPRLVSARVPVARVVELAASPAVHHFEFSMERGQLMNDSMRVKNRVDQVQQGLAPLSQGYDGTGVVVGFIDSGLDILHPDFRDANNNSRVYRYWDQVPAANPGSPAPYGYGTEWTTAELEAGGSSIPNDNASGHGTTVMGTAAGNGLANGRHKGVASGADIIAVATNFGLPNWQSTVADGVAYILAQAEALGKPAVINASLGSYGGSHDGKDAAALFIEDLIDQQGGRAMVAAAGNSNAEFPYHMRTEVDADTSFTWFTTNQNTAAGTNNAQVETKTGPGGLSIGSVAKDGKEVVNNNVTQSANNKAITETQQRTDAGNGNTTVRDADGVAMQAGMAADRVGRVAGLEFEEV